MSLIDKNVKKPPTEIELSLSALAKMAATAAEGIAASAQMTAYSVAMNALETTLGVRFDPAPSCLFYVELSGVIVGFFTEVGGLKLERETEEVVKQGGMNDHVIYLPGRIKQEKITLKRGMSVNQQLWAWFEQGRYNMHVKRINFSIIQGAPGHALLTGLPSNARFGKIRQWDFEDAYPVSYELSTLNTDDDDKVVIESLEIVHHGMSISIDTLTPMSISEMAVSAISEATGVEMIRPEETHTIPTNQNTPQDEDSYTSVNEPEEEPEQPPEPETPPEPPGAIA